MIPQATIHRARALVLQFDAIRELANAVENVAALNRQTSEAQAALAAVKKQQEEAALELEILHAAKRDLADVQVKLAHARAEEQQTRERIAAAKAAALASLG